MVNPGVSMPPIRPIGAPPNFHVLAKPTGAICNLNCEYCYFLTKEKLYPGDRFRMGAELVEAYIRQLIEAQQGPEVTIAWQGGEPTLLGVDFFRQAVKIVERYRRSGQVVNHTIQTNGTLLTDEWCEFFADNGFLVGISIDGPREMHDAYRVDKQGNPTFDAVAAGLALLMAHDVDTNVLCAVNAANQHDPLGVYRFFRDDLGLRYIQLIPIVERLNETGFQEGDTVTERSVDPIAWGEFLVTIFDEWIKRDVGTVFVGHFDAALASWLGIAPAMCVFRETCGDALALEHNGDLYSCDHYVEPDYLLGNILDTHMVDLVGSPKQLAFGLAKRDALPAQCRRCEVRFACQGECPKNRFTVSEDGEYGLNYLCAGYYRFFTHIDPYMRQMAELMRSGRRASEIMEILGRSPTGR